MAGQPAKRFPSFWQLQLAGWAGFSALVLVGSIPDIKRPGTLFEQSVGLVYMFLGCWALHPICRWFFRASSSWIAFEWRAFLASVVAGTAGAFLAELSVLGFRDMQWANLATNSVQFAVVMFLWCSLYFSIKQWEQLSLERERLLRAESAARAARLSALRYQLNPHFLFNSLNAVSTLVLEGNAAAATRMLAQVGELLRSTLDHEDVLEVPLANEIAFTRQYLAIEQTRLGERLRVEWNISPDTLDALVPSMLLQPLIENAVRYGIAPALKGGAILIASSLHGRRVQIMIRNSGERARPQKRCDGIGLSNTAERLHSLYGADHRFSLEWPADGGCEVTLELPERTLARQQEAPACAR